MAGPGRNDPCPCGSGKKFKQCCLVRRQAATGITARDRTEAISALMKYSRREEFDTIVAESARDWADMPVASPQEALQAIFEFETSTQAFFDWLFFDVPTDDGRTIADAFLSAREWTVSARAADYVRIMRGTHLRLYQVREVRPGAGFTVRDLWTKGDLFITERLGSTQLVKWDVLAARVCEHSDGTHQGEGSIMALPPDAAKPLLKELRSEYKSFARRHPEAPLAEFFKQSAPLVNDAARGGRRSPPEAAVTGTADRYRESGGAPRRRWHRSRHELVVEGVRPASALTLSARGPRDQEGKLLGTITSGFCSSDCCSKTSARTLQSASVTLRCGAPRSRG
jgi:hypothetical protein